MRRRVCRQVDTDETFAGEDGTNKDETNDYRLMPKNQTHCVYRPLAGYGLPPPRGNFVDHIFLEAQCLARILQHVSPLTMAALSCNSLLRTLPYKIFDN